jgi:hypothetical protein
LEQKDLFGEPLQKKPVKKKPVKWCLSTNHLNLMYMLSAGLILSPKGFGKKYYSDVLNTFPGWIPLFADAIPKQVLHISTEEERHLRSCAAIINLSSLSGPVTAISRDGSVREITFPDGLNGLEAALLLPSPLPASWIETVVFPSKEDKQAWEKDAQDFANVPLNDYKREVNAGLIAGSNTGTWPPNGATPPHRDKTPHAALTAGAMMAMLFHLANRSDEAMNACRLLFDGEESVAAAITDPLIGGLYEWRETGIPPTANMLPGLFWGAIDKVGAARLAIDAPNPRDTVFEFLSAAKNTLDEKPKAALIKLLDDLRSIAGYADSTITEILERHSKRFPRVMALFFLRQNGAELLELKYPLLSENDYIASALLFAARDGWLGLPLEIRDQPGMTAAVSHRMAAMAHRLSGSGLNCGHPPPRCIPFRELFAPGARGWSVKQKEAALLLAKESGWDFVYTRISLGKGDYQLVIDASGAHIVLPGEVRAVETELDKKQFFKKLPEVKISRKLDQKMRVILSHR